MRKILIAVVVTLAVVLIGADIYARNTAQTRIAQEIKTYGGLNSTPEVDIGGWSFLLQVVRGHYDDIQITATDIGRSTGVPITSVQANVHDLAIPMTALTSGSMPGQLPAQTVTVQAATTYEVLAERVEHRLSPYLTNVQITSSGSDHVEISGTIHSKNVSADVTAPLIVTISSPSQLHIAVETDHGNGDAAAVARQLKSLLQTDLNVSDLPFGLKVDSVQFQASSVILNTSGHQIDLRDWR